MSILLGFGLITCQRYPGDDATDAEIYGRALALAEQADALGLDSVWVSEHHFVDDGYLPSALPMCAAIAARTRRAAIGTGLILAPLHDPLRLAEDAAVTDLIAGGRLILGLGLGWREEEFDALGVPLAERVPRLTGTVDVLRGAWRGDLVPGGARQDGPAVAVRPLPARPGGPPIWIGAMADRAVARAGRIADGFMAAEVTPQTLAGQVAVARAARAAAGLTAPLAVSMHLPTFAWDDADEAWSLIRDHVRYGAWKYADMESARARAGAPAAPPPWGPDDDEDALRASVVLGTPWQVARRIDEFRRAAGGDLHYVASGYLPGLPEPIQQRSLRILADQVLPLVRELDLAGRR